MERNTPRKKDEDDISITSTAPSEGLDEYEVEGILAQRTDEDGEKYLVKWTGYSLIRSTWEPEESFLDPEILVNWRKEREDRARNEKPTFNLQAFEVLLENSHKATLQRKRRRRAKRIRLGLLDSSSKPGEHDDTSDTENVIPAKGDSNDSYVSDKPVTKSAQPANAPTKHSVEQTANSGVASSSPALPVNANLGTKGDQTPIKKSQPRGLKENLTQNAPGSLSKPKPKRTEEIISNTPNRPKPAGTMFRNLSSQWKHQKAARRERTPDISQLEIRKPGDWLETGQSTNPDRANALNTHQNDDSLFVEQDISTEDCSRSPQQNVEPTPSPRYADRSSLDRPTQEIEKERNDWPGRPLPPTGPAAHRVQNMKRSKTGSRYREWHFGEVSVYLTSSPTGTEIGDVRFCGLNGISKKLLISLSVKSRVPIDVSEICNVDQYRELCKTIHNRAYGHGWVTGYDDTEFNLNRFADYLRQHNVVALWHYPSTENPSTFIFYAAGMGQWSVLDGETIFPPSAQLRIAVRSPLASVASANSTEPGRLSVQHYSRPLLPYATKPLVNQSPFIQSPTGQSPINQSPIHQPLISQSRTTHPLVIQSPTVDSAIIHALEEHIESPGALSSHRVNEDLKDLPTITPDLNIKMYFRKHYGITFEELAIANGNKSKSNTAHAFYLCFPEDMENEYQLVRHFLKKYTNVIFSNRHPDDWDRFVELATNGTALFHQKYISYDDMRGLHKLLRGAINIFNISLAEPIKGIDDECHIQRLFPHGGAILLTEDFMRNRTQEAIKVVQWFGFLMSTKFPGTWKMYFRPNVLQWLRNLWPQWPDTTMYHLYIWIEALIPDQFLSDENTGNESDSDPSLDGLTDDEGQHLPFISPRVLPGYGSGAEGTHESTPKGLAQAERNADHLIENFAGWSLMNCDKHRRFIAITQSKPQPRWEQWNHICVLNYDEFYRKLLEPEFNSMGWKKWWASLNPPEEEKPTLPKTSENTPKKDSSGDTIMKE